MILLQGSISLLPHSTSKGIVSSQVTIRELLNAYIIDHDINRDINYGRIPDIIKYLESAGETPGIFIPAFVFSYRGDPGSKYDAANAVFLLEDKSLVIIDGQHRIKAIQRYTEKHPENSYFLGGTVTVQVYFGLSIDEEKQLFVDINSHAKRVSRSLVMKYDSREVSNLLIQELYRSCSSLRVAGIELEKSKVQRPVNTSFATGFRLKTLIYYLLFGKKKVSKNDESLIAEHYDAIVAFLIRFFDELFTALPEVPGDVRRYVLGHEPMQNAIALYFHENFVSLDNHGLQITGVWEDGMADIGSLDWSVHNVEWRRMGITKSTTHQGQYLGFNLTETEQLYSQIQRQIAN